jgi:hypothetical protein
MLSDFLEDRTLSGFIFQGILCVLRLLCGEQFRLYSVLIIEEEAWIISS